MAGFWIVFTWLLAFLSIIAGMALAVIVMLLFACVIRLIAYMLLFRKAGEPEWAVFVPFMNVYKAYKISIGRMWFWFWLTGNAILVFLRITAQRISVPALPESMVGYLHALDICSMALLVILFIMNIVQKVKLAKAFGASTAFAVGIVFLPDIFLLILGLSNQYQYHPNQEGTNL